MEKAQRNKVEISLDKARQMVVVRYIGASGMAMAERDYPFSGDGFVFRAADGSITTHVARWISDGVLPTG